MDYEIEKANEMVDLTSSWRKKGYLQSKGGNLPFGGFPYVKNLQKVVCVETQASRTGS
jgi:hypothetical protein